MIELVVSSEPLSQVLIARACVEVARSDDRLEPEVRLYGESVSVRSLERALSGRKSFVIEASGFKAHLALLSGHRVALLTFECGSADTETKLATEITETAVVVSARWIDSEYDYWQNAEDPLVFTSAGRTLHGLPMRSNGLPPPLDQMVVDISDNPGRRTLRDGYVEAIGHKMWLGPEFFRRVPGANREAVLSASWLKASTGPHDMLEVLASDEPFRDETTKSAQDRLRLLLFPTA